MANEHVLTKSGKLEMEQELEYLKSVKRAEIAEQIKVARSFGDLSENAEYTEARNEQSRIEGRITDLEEILKNAVVVDDDDVALDVVGIGTKVRLLDLDYNEEEVYQILGSTESDIQRNNITNESPVGKALIGKKIGQEVDVDAPGGVVRFRILEISKAEKN